MTDYSKYSKDWVNFIKGLPDPFASPAYEEARSRRNQAVNYLRMRDQVEQARSQEAGRAERAAAAELGRNNRALFNQRSNDAREAARAAATAEYRRGITELKKRSVALQESHEKRSAQSQQLRDNLAQSRAFMDAIRLHSEQSKTRNALRKEVVDFVGRLKKRSSSFGHNFTQAELSLLRKGDENPFAGRISRLKAEIAGLDAKMSVIHGRAEKDDNDNRSLRAGIAEHAQLTAMLKATEEHLAEYRRIKGESTTESRFQDAQDTIQMIEELVGSYGSRVPQASIGAVRTAFEAMYKEYSMDPAELASIFSHLTGADPKTAADAAKQVAADKASTPPSPALDGGPPPGMSQNVIPLDEAGAGTSGPGRAPSSVTPSGVRKVAKALSKRKQNVEELKNLYGLTDDEALKMLSAIPRTSDPSISSLVPTEVSGLVPKPTIKPPVQPAAALTPYGSAFGPRSAHSYPTEMDFAFLPPDKQRAVQEEANKLTADVAGGAARVGVNTVQALAETVGDAAAEFTGLANPMDAPIFGPDTMGVIADPGKRVAGLDPTGSGSFEGPEYGLKDRFMAGLDLVAGIGQSAKGVTPAALTDLSGGGYAEGTGRPELSRFAANYLPELIVGSGVEAFKTLYAVAEGSATQEEGRTPLAQILHNIADASASEVQDGWEKANVKYLNMPQAERAKAFNDRFLKNLGRLRSFIDHASEEYGLGGVDGPIDHYEAIQKATAEYLKEKGIDPALNPFGQGLESFVRRRANLVGNYIDIKGAGEAIRSVSKNIADPGMLGRPLAGSSFAPDAVPEAAPHPRGISVGREQIARTVQLFDHIRELDQRRWARDQPPSRLAIDEAIDAIERVAEIDPLRIPDDVAAIINRWQDQAIGPRQRVADAPGRKPVGESGAGDVPNTSYDDLFGTSHDWLAVMDPEAARARDSSAEIQRAWAGLFPGGPPPEAWAPPAPLSPRKAPPPAPPSSAHQSATQAFATASPAPPKAPPPAPPPSPPSAPALTPPPAPTSAVPAAGRASKQSILGNLAPQKRDVPEPAQAPPLQTPSAQQPTAQDIFSNLAPQDPELAPSSPPAVKSPAGGIAPRKTPWAPEATVAAAAEAINNMSPEDFAAWYKSEDAKSHLATPKAEGGPKAGILKAVNRRARKEGLDSPLAPSRDGAAASPRESEPTPVSGVGAEVRAGDAQELAARADEPLVENAEAAKTPRAVGSPAKTAKAVEADILDGYEKLMSRDVSDATRGTDLKAFLKKHRITAAELDRLTGGPTGRAPKRSRSVHSKARPGLPRPPSDFVVDPDGSTTPVKRGPLHEVRYREERFVNELYGGSVRQDVSDGDYPSLPGAVGKDARAREPAGGRLDFDLRAVPAIPEHFRQFFMTLSKERKARREGTEVLMLPEVIPSGPAGKAESVPLTPEIHDRVDAAAKSAHPKSETLRIQKGLPRQAESVPRQSPNYELAKSIGDPADVSPRAAVGLGVAEPKKRRPRPPPPAPPRGESLSEAVTRILSGLSSLKEKSRSLRAMLKKSKADLPKQGLSKQKPATQSLTVFTQMKEDFFNLVDELFGSDYSRAAADELADPRLEDIIDTDEGRAAYLEQQRASRQLGVDEEGVGKWYESYHPDGPEALFQKYSKLLEDTYEKAYAEYKYRNDKDAWDSNPDLRKDTQQRAAEEALDAIIEQIMRDGDSEDIDALGLPSKAAENILLSSLMGEAINKAPEPRDLPKWVKEKIDDGRHVDTSPPFFVDNVKSLQEFDSIEAARNWLDNLETRVKASGYEMEHSLKHGMIEKFNSQAEELWAIARGESGMLDKYRGDTEVSIVRGIAQNLILEGLVREAAKLHRKNRGEGPAPTIHQVAEKAGFLKRHHKNIYETAPYIIHSELRDFMRGEGDILRDAAGEGGLLKPSSIESPSRLELAQKKLKSIEAEIKQARKTAGVLGVSGGKSPIEALRARRRRVLEEIRVLKQEDPARTERVVGSSEPARPSDSWIDERAGGVVRQRSEYLFTGWAKGADRAFIAAAKKVGLKPEIFQPVGTTHGITKQQHAEGAVVAEQVRQLGRKTGTFTRNTPVRADDTGWQTRYLIRNWQQVKNASAVYAIIEGFEPPSKTREFRKIKGAGTPWTVEMAIRDARGEIDGRPPSLKPVYVFDQEGNRWYQYSVEGDRFYPTPVRVEYKNGAPFNVDTPPFFRGAAGVGTRKLTERGARQIEALLGVGKTKQRISVRADSPDTPGWLRAERDVMRKKILSATKHVEAGAGFADIRSLAEHMAQVERTRSVDVFEELLLDARNRPVASPQGITEGWTESLVRQLPDGLDMGRGERIPVREVMENLNKSMARADAMEAEFFELIDAHINKHGLEKAQRTDFFAEKIRRRLEILYNRDVNTALNRKFLEKNANYPATSDKMYILGEEGRKVLYAKTMEWLNRPENKSTLDAYLSWKSIDDRLQSISGASYRLFHFPRSKRKADYPFATPVGTRTSLMNKHEFQRYPSLNFEANLMERNPYKIVRDYVRNQVRYGMGFHDYAEFVLRKVRDNLVERFTENSEIIKGSGFGPQAIGFDAYMNKLLGNRVTEGEDSGAWVMKSLFKRRLPAAERARLEAIELGQREAVERIKSLDADYRKLEDDLVRANEQDAEDIREALKAYRKEIAETQGIKDAFERQSQELLDRHPRWKKLFRVMGRTPAHDLVRTIKGNAVFAALSRAPLRYVVAQHGDLTSIASGQLGMDKEAVKAMAQQWLKLYPQTGSTMKNGLEGFARKMFGLTLKDYSGAIRDSMMDTGHYETAGFSIRRLDPDQYLGVKHDDSLYANRIDDYARFGAGKLGKARSKVRYFGDRMNKFFLFPFDSGDRVLSWIAAVGWDAKFRNDLKEIGGRSAWMRDPDAFWEAFKKRQSDYVVGSMMLDNQLKQYFKSGQFEKARNHMSAYGSKSAAVGTFLPDRSKLHLWSNFGEGNEAFELFKGLTFMFTSHGAERSQQTYRTARAKMPDAPFLVQSVAGTKNYLPGVIASGLMAMTIATALNMAFEEKESMDDAFFTGVFFSMFQAGIENPLLTSLMDMFAWSGKRTSVVDDWLSTRRNELLPRGAEKTAGWPASILNISSDAAQSLKSGNRPKMLKTTNLWGRERAKDFRGISKKAGKSLSSVLGIGKPKPGGSWKDRPVPASKSLWRDK